MRLPGALALRSKCIVILALFFSFGPEFFGHRVDFTHEGGPWSACWGTRLTWEFQGSGANVCACSVWALVGGMLTFYHSPPGAALETLTDRKSVV